MVFFIYQGILKKSLDARDNTKENKKKKFARIN